MTCKSCNAEVAGNVKFCPECGAKIEPGDLICSGCGIKLEPNTKFCPECGTKTGVSTKNNDTNNEADKDKLAMVPYASKDAVALQQKAVPEAPSRDAGLEVRYKSNGSALH